MTIDNQQLSFCAGRACSSRTNASWLSVVLGRIYANEREKFAIEEDRQEKSTRTIICWSRKNLILIAKEIKKSMIRTRIIREKQSMGVLERCRDKCKRDDQKSKSTHITAVFFSLRLQNASRFFEKSFIPFRLWSHTHLPTFPWQPATVLSMALKFCFWQGWDARSPLGAFKLF